MADNINELLKDMETKDLAETGSRWIKRAIAEKPDRISLMLVSSSLPVYDRFDRIVTRISRSN